MAISILRMLISIALYSICAATAAWYILHLSKLAPAKDQPARRLVFSMVRDIAVLSVVPIVASIIVLFGPSVVKTVLINGESASSPFSELVAFCVAQMIWSLPSACFYVVATRLLRERFSLRKVVTSSIALFGVFAILALMSGSPWPLLAAGVVAQVVAGVLPLSVASSLPATLSITTNGGWSGVDWGSVSIARAACLCAAVLSGYLFLKNRRSRFDRKA